MIVTVTPTIGDGTVIRWYRDTDPVDVLNAIEPTISASRNGVRVSGFLHEVPEDVMTAAQEVWQTLRRDNDADFSELATHRRRGGLFGPYEPVPAKQETAG